MEDQLNEKEILQQIDFHEKEIYKLRQLLPKAREVLNTNNLGRNDIIRLNENRIESKYKEKIEVEDKSHFFYDKKVVLTGVFPSFNNRNEMAAMLQNVGADVNGSISKLTDYVVVGQKAGPKKLELIEKFGIETLSEHDFIKLF